MQLIVSRRKPDYASTVPADLVPLQAKKPEAIDELPEPENGTHRNEKSEQSEACLNGQSFVENLRRFGIEL